MDNVMRELAKINTKLLIGTPNNTNIDHSPVTDIIPIPKLRKILSTKSRDLKNKIT